MAYSHSNGKINVQGHLKEKGCSSDFISLGANLHCASGLNFAALTFFFSPDDARAAAAMMIKAADWIDANGATPAAETALAEVA